ncbi:hypothetical protein BDP55DRAFT_362042 [Colletotrichum godetiae]|uniref:Uncharacterized protein n=1 Tax=Colletotrichum godetiae TaxID=1209918 RepID=A0AAJ0AA07_9PEZI|nr:uncharacterized protein BDP55DRAFT_362042 [Colletotrichum godetiae]KAK1659300.1 hypothetical protein BDP55DRAFT_362042 [Colletotrichum godetiae]
MLRSRAKLKRVPFPSILEMPGTNSSVPTHFQTNTYTNNSNKKPSNRAFLWYPSENSQYLSTTPGHPRNPKSLSRIK